MISNRSNSRSTSNFIYKNIQHFNVSRSTFTSHKTKNFTVSGVSIALTTKDANLKAQRKKVEGKVSRESEIAPLTENLVKSQHQQKALKLTTSVKRAAPPGIRKTSIRAKSDGHAIGSVGKRGNKETCRNLENRRTNKTREALTLPISWIPTPDRSHVNVIDILLNLISLKLKDRGNKEALNRRVEVLERILAAMDVSDKIRQCRDSEHDVNVQFDQLTLDKKQDQSYEHIYQRHVDELQTVISHSDPENQDCAPPDIKKPKKKTLPKLEIKIVATEKFLNTDAEDFDGTRLADEVESSCGDVTPVITYNHVTTVNAHNELLFGVTVSPGSSSKGSRSPSPLLEVPPTPGEICTKFPTGSSTSIAQSATPST